MAGKTVEAHTQTSWILVCPNCRNAVSDFESCQDCGAIIWSDEEGCTECNPSEAKSTPEQQERQIEQ